MVTNYYTLRWIAEDLNRRLVGAKLTQLFTQQRDELVITCATRAKQYCLVVSCRKALNYMYLREAFPRAKKNSVDIFLSLVGARIREVSVHPYDRELFLDTDRGTRLAIRPHGSSANVLLLVDSHIEDAFLNRKEHIGTMYRNRQWIHEPDTVEKLHERLQQSNELYRSLKALFPRYGSEVVREMLFLCGLAEDTAASTLNRQQVELLWDTSRQLEQLLLKQATPRVYFEGNVPRTFSIIPLNHLHALRCEQYESIHTAIRTFIGLTHRQHEFEQHRRALMQRLRASLERDERHLERSIDEAGERVRQYETMGKLLMAHLDILHKGMREVVLENTITSSPAQLTIALDPALSPAKNAERYFDKAKATRQKNAELAKKKDRLMRRVQCTRNLLERLESVDDADVFEKFLDKHRTELEEAGCAVDEKTKPQKQEAALFRVFTVAGGFQVWAGKSSENNDLLTMKHAKPNDLWFHARGSSGSHVVLKVGTGKGEPSKLAIQQAAGIAAYYSKMKNSKLVPVAMTERKYVRKPKGAPVGTVTLEREKTIFAEPKLPANSLDNV